MNLRPILSTLRRNKIACALIILQVTLSCAIICNALFLISDLSRTLSAPSGIEEDHLLQIRLGGLTTDESSVSRSREDLAALRSINGLASVAMVNQLPFNRSSSWDTSLASSPDQEYPTMQAAMYMGGEGLTETLGLRLLMGRDFQHDEFRSFDEIMGDEETAESRLPILISETIAHRMFPDGSPLGQTIYMANIPLTVIGVIETLAPPFWHGEPYSFVLPARIDYTDGFYILRVQDPSRRGEILEAAVAALDNIDTNRLLLESRTYDENRREYFSDQRTMIWLLVTAITCLMTITALGIIGLASFWVSQRTQQIGIRRALGATRRQILTHFQLENFLLATAGIALGMIGAYAINQLLMAHYEVPRLPLHYLPLGALVLWTLGQVAVLGPACRAASVPPSVATRK